MKHIKTLIAIATAGLLAAPAIATEPERSFPAVDEDRSGELSWYEAMQVQRFHHRWNEMDQDGDLRVSLSEYSEFARRHGIRDLPVDTAATSPFGPIDRTADGYLYWIEVNSTEELRYRWSLLDRNRDVRVDPAEYRAYRKGDRSL